MEVVDARVALILDTARRLIPGLAATAKRAESSVDIVGSLRATGGSVGIIRGRPELVLLLAMEGVGRWTLEFSRPSMPLSDHEWEVLGRLPDAIATSLSSPAALRHRVAHQISSRLGLEHVLIAQVLRRARAAGFWRPMLLLEALIDLTFRRYEGQQATTGVVFTSREELYRKAVRNEHPYVLDAFQSPLPLTYDLFTAPAAFRYVDGRNSFYLLDRKFDIVGVLRAKNPGTHSIIDRCSLRHVDALVRGMPGRVWLAYVGFNSDIHVLRSDGVHLHWQQNHWRVRDRALIQSLLEEHGCEPQTIDLLLTLLETLSELRLGSVLLIPNTLEALPPVVGKIDGSLIAAQLREQIAASNIADLVRSHAAIGVLSSDGLTTISKRGDVLSCGDILDLSGTTTTSMAGGGRSQAARVASEFGLAIKVSEDGPITVYRGGQAVVTL